MENNLTSLGSGKVAKPPTRENERERETERRRRESRCTLFLKNLKKPVNLKKPIENKTLFAIIRFYLAI